MSNAPPIGCFGKLSIAADFISHNAGGPEARAFEQWLEEGIGLGRKHLGDGWRPTFTASPGFRFLFSREAAEPRLLGTFRPSHDQSGRRFPFSVFTLLSSGAVPPAGDWPVRFHAFLDGASGIVDKAESLGIAASVGLGPLTDALEALRPLLPDASTPDVQHPQNHPAQNLVNALGGSADGEPLLSVGANLLQLAPRFEGAAVPRYGLRFPLPPPGGQHLPAVSFWLDLAQAAIPRLRPVAVFWTESNYAGPGFLDLYPWLPGGLSFLHLVDGEFSSDVLFPLDESLPAQPQSPAATWMHGLSPALQGSASLADLVGLVRS